MAQKVPQEPPSGAWHRASLALSIPTLMLAGPLTGLLVGFALVRVFHAGPPWKLIIMIGMTILGTAGGLREAIRVIRRISSGS